MKLQLINDKGHTVACFEDLEGYDAENPGHVFALLDFLETLLAAAKGHAGGRGSEVSSLATVPASE